MGRTDTHFIITLHQTFLFQRAEEQRKLNPRDPILLSRLAEYRSELGEREQAMQLAQLALREGSREPAVLVTVAGVYEYLGERDRAVTSIIEAVERGYPADQIRTKPIFEPLFGDHRVVEALERLDQGY